MIIRYIDSGLSSNNNMIRIDDDDNIANMMEMSSPIAMYSKSFDGASLQNPGLASSGRVIRSDDGSFIAAFGNPLGITSNNYAEFLALQAGVDLAIQLKCFPLQIESDSLVLDNAIHDRCKAPWELSIVAANCRYKLSDHVWSLTHIYREANIVVGLLAKKTTTFSNATVWRSRPLDFLSLALLLDVAQLPYSRAIKL
ncbi:uncharacterized protein LOC105420454 [Amborella trichopoda]|uniref:uncharacterized protein LOC105420454 n=1 Tax=Amborella trichopoda TaxID=13333 RepID=UPI0005D384A3|nr:uncharacterized protein LOC105420454 [Amborella trichopoda]|eukprot:XP_011622406.1 uncharacterized protein LOC105420454 [Amborella trichopoda]